MCALSVYLADLRHNYSGVLANDCMPLGVGYLKAVMDRDLPCDVTSRVFAYPDRLLEALTTSPPDILMLSNYVWNEELSLLFARIAKRVRPGVLTVLGGPNIPLEGDRQIAYVASHPEIDVYVLGEGDFLATEAVKQFLEADRDLLRLRTRAIPSAIQRGTDGEFVLQPMWPRHREIDDIPSVWLSGIMDEFFDGRLAPMIETNRGCPFTCSFCVQGTSWYTKVHNFSKERVKAEIAYIARKVHTECPTMGTLRIADSNYGMFERDIEISSYIGEAQREYGWPVFIDATTGKNRADRIIQSLEKVNGSLVLYQAVQSLDERVLRNVKRQTIKVEAYEQLQVHIRGRGLRSNSDLILGLPGETLSTHIAAIHKLVDAGTSEMHNFQAMLLKGSEMESRECRGAFAFQSRFRVLPKNFGIYGTDKVFDMDEIVVSTDSLPFSDYLEARRYHLVCSIFWNNGWFAQLIDLCSRYGITASRWLDAIDRGLESAGGEVRQLLEDFRAETEGELFETRKACAAFYEQEEQFRRLKEGEIGDNLMYRYRAIASFKLWPFVCKVACDITRRLLADTELAAAPDFDEIWRDLHRFVELSHACGYTSAELLSPAYAVLSHDVPGWIHEGFSSDLSRYRLVSPRRAEFRLSESAERELAAGIQVWTTDIKALSKMVTRIRPSCQVRECSMVEAR